ncbi:MAG: hypothetical protein ACRDJJ_04920 [Actinomycetota bacterium]
MIFLVPSLLLLLALIALYQWRMQTVPWVFLLVAAVVILQAAVLEAFGVQAGAEVGSSSTVAILVVALLGCAVVKPVWRLGLSAILCVIGAVSAVVAYEIGGIYFDDILTRIDENPILLLAAAFILATVGVAVARDLPAWPRGLIASPIVLLVISQSRESARPPSPSVVTSCMAHWP